jgi:hypothetical protein
MAAGREGSVGMSCQRVSLKERGNNAVNVTTVGDFDDVLSGVVVVEKTGGGGINKFVDG